MSNDQILTNKNDLEDIVSKKLNQASALVTIMQAAMDAPDRPTKKFINNAFWLLGDTLDEAIDADKSLSKIGRQERLTSKINAPMESLDTSTSGM
tara:strand:- start:2591 stop:2875 length:285 start_codon:yes stop_codon:yes gene_type:complete